MTANYIGIDVGGSKLAIAGQNRNARLFDARLEISSKEPATVLTDLVAILDEQCTRHGRADCIAVASAPNLGETGVVTCWPSHPNWEGVDISSALAPFALRRIVWCDDGTAAALADSRALKTDSLIHFALGSGVGGTVLFDGLILANREVGHLIVNPDGPNCSCGRRGCLQAYASGNSMTVQADSLSRADWIAAASRALAVCSANLIELFRCREISLSGGVVDAMPEIAVTLEQDLRNHYLKHAATMPRVSISPHGANASLQGALILASANTDLWAALCQERIVSTS